MELQECVRHSIRHVNFQTEAYVLRTPRRTDLTIAETVFKKKDRFLTTEIITMGMIRSGSGFLTMAYAAPQTPLVRHRWNVAGGLGDGQMKGKDAPPPAAIQQQEQRHAAPRTTVLSHLGADFPYFYNYCVLVVILALICLGLVRHRIFLGKPAVSSIITQLKKMDSDIDAATRNYMTHAASNSTSSCTRSGSTRLRKTRKDPSYYSPVTMEDYTGTRESHAHTEETPSSTNWQYTPTIPSFYTPPASPTRETTTRGSSMTHTNNTPTSIASRNQNIPWNTLQDTLVKANPTQNLHHLQIPWNQDSPSNSYAHNNPGTVIHKRKHLILDGSSDASSSLSTLIPLKDIQFISIIGGGGFGQVWSANWKGTPVAVKQLSSSILYSFTNMTLSSPIGPNWNHKIIQEFCAEIQMLRAMRHPNICLYMGACLELPHLAIVTELATHGSLWDALRTPIQSSFLLEPPSNLWPTILFGFNHHPTTSKKIIDEIPIHTWPWHLIKRIATDAARGMNYLHSGDPPILHRDLKSANILLDEAYHAKIADFGFSRLKAHHTQSMTGNCGTVQWMAPEVLSNQPYAEPADVYSYGIILWELLSRECPFQGLSSIQCALAVINTDARPTIPKWCPNCLASLIQSCVHKDPTSRPSFGQIIKAFDSMPS